MELNDCPFVADDGAAEGHTQLSNAVRLLVNGHLISGVVHDVDEFANLQNFGKLLEEHGGRPNSDSPLPNFIHLREAAVLCEGVMEPLPGGGVRIELVDVAGVSVGG